MRILIILALSAFSLGITQGQTIKKPPLEVSQLQKDVYVHVTYGIYQNQAIPSNGLIVNTKEGVVLIDTGWDTKADTDNTRQILHWVDQHLHQPVKLCIVTHSHDDRVGGISELKKAGVRVISTPLTAQKSIKEGYESPEAILPSDTSFTIGKVPFRCYFPGEGHTSDNIVVWLPSYKILHGGCLVKSVATFGMGNIADANLKEWGKSMKRLMQAFGSPRWVIPGHDTWGDHKALEHTFHLVEKFSASKL
ncbi:subclass B1 metallo-beta-lactamase [Siphonobacter sp. SORGH_AS_0500]|uniref:subclass B1 metallo-beta-lactamase n=1 Tax=Siphonobacter sp. SORGH_AS_0500 TaxID=1864824 RepID=UPI000CC099DF|nr:subclass B1 metallo-beta-lactamase [Siphonobacter sp. SORGH_AS_0500]PKK36364.1 subclass B1 metallo-beta-lactamase [Siphonobacter sp. SORGH_AS_0500]